MAVRAAQPRNVTVYTGGQMSPSDYKGPFYLVHCAKHHFEGPWPCDCTPGPQKIAWFSDADELATGGSRGSAKTHILLGWMAFKGNPRIVNGAVVGQEEGYYNDPHFRGLLLREQSADLLDLVDRAEEMYTPTGARITRGNPAIAEWPSGAKVIFGFFGDGGFAKYIGQEYQRIGIDQAEMIPNREIHDRIAGSCRSKWPKLKTQMMLTFNPGGGEADRGAPGQGWLMEYFHIDDYLNGRLKQYQKFREKTTGKTRVFIPSRVTDNPYLCYKTEYGEGGRVVVVKDSEGVPVEGDYLRWLKGIEPESLRKAWLDGDWRALTGGYFQNFRPNGPLSGEPENANHVYDPAKVFLEPYFHRWMALDWGYIHPTDIQFFCKSPWGQVYVEREISLNRVEPVELGVLIAREARPVLRGLESRHMIVYCSPDAFNRRDGEDNSVAHQIASGINKELGPGSCFVAKFNADERELSAEQALISLQNRRRDQQSTMLTLVPASNDRVGGWMHIQTLLSWTPSHPVNKPDMEYANKLYEEKGVIYYQEYLNSPEFKTVDPVLPRLQISNQCRELIKCLPRLQYKPGTNDVQKFDATETMAGEDSADAMRYGLISEERQGEKLAPLARRVDDRVKAIVQASPGLSLTSIGQMHMNIERSELKKGRTTPPVYGHNRLAVRRAMQQTGRKF